MTLEDFFTLSEMKDGLSDPARVKELINVMQDDEHNIVKNVGDATRQWSAVARTIEATESKECLALFIQLDGLCYFDTWLKDGQKFFKEAGDSFVEELLSTLLVSIEKLHIDRQKSVSSGIVMTVKDLLTNKSSRVQDRARALLDSWKKIDESNVVHKDADKDEAGCDDHHDLEDVNGNPMPQIRSCDKLGATDSSFGADSINTVESKVGANIEKDFDAKKEDPCPKICSYGDVRKEVSEGKGDMCDSRSSYPCSKLSASDSTAAVDILQDSSFSEHNLGKNEDLTTNLSWKENAEAIEESNDQSDTDEDEVELGNDYDFTMSGVNLKDSIDKKSDFELEFSMFDPLEVARQVAMEVEREVDCRESSCSSSERMSGGRIRLAESPDPIHDKNRTVHPSFKDVSTRAHLSAVGDDAFAKAKNLPNEQENCIVDAEASGAAEMAQKTEPDEDKRGCGFDLNEEMLSDNNELNPVGAPISVVSASRPAAASGLPLSPLQFEGTLGWKGSSETSAFRPAPTHKVCEGENFIIASGSSSYLFQQKECLDFDLNVAENEDDKIMDVPLNKDIQNPTGWPSERCSWEASPKKIDLLNLDLNRVSDSCDVPFSNWRKETRVLPLWNGKFSQSPSSSSSVQPSLKNFDLNDQPSLFTTFSDPATTGKSSTDLCTFGSGGVKPDKSVFSLLGARVEVNQKEIVPQTVPLSNSRTVKHALDGSMPSHDSFLGLGSSTQYAHTSMYGYNGRSSGSTVPFSSSVYGLGGQIPYMVDSRGSPVLPQVLGSVPALHPSISQPSFFMSLAAAPSESNGFVPSRHGLDLNSGLMMERGNRDPGSTRQLFNLGHGILIDEQMRANSQSTSSSGGVGKRKETDGGWDPYPFNYKHHQPPW
ncbi:hypothetical protein POM88_010252 [Heracleum sosnowskyi]|uniref:TFIIS N-terminal domain-containing protein n=1 Tax=Heracleum sosnowskyi TaxID=360622 RepID=A0AAD8JAD1_9APIA|nr:hypothetical protein POM88_010252 [Heracleum sosnowskyi]